ncbi:MAG: FtsX-like permease family protein [Chloroflexota bacterium]
MILKNLSRRLIRSLLTLTGIAIGVAAIVGLSAMAGGISSNYATAVGGGTNDLLAIQANAIDPVFSKLDQNLAQRVQAIPDVQNVDAGAYGWVALDDLPVFLVFGYETNSSAIQHYRVVEGKPVTGPGQIIVGQRAMESLKMAVGDTLRIYGAPYRIVGIYETGQAMEESGGVLVLEDAQEILQFERQVSLFQIGLRRGGNPEQVIERIESFDDDIKVSRTSEREANQQWDGILQGYVWGIGGIAILIGGLGMMNAMVMSVMERTREIGTLRAVGWSRWRILRMILGESLLLSFFGGLLGLLLGTLMAEAVEAIPGYGAMLTPAYSVGGYVQGMVTALVLGLIGGVYPAWRAANLQPIEALRYEGGGTLDAGKGWLSRVGNQSFRNLWRRRNRTLIAASSIGIGVATLVMLGGITNGMIGQLNNLAGSGSPGSITVMQRDVPDISLSSLDERMVRLIQAMPQVKSVSPTMLGVLMTEEMPLFIITGLDPNSAAVDHYKIVEGRRIQRPNEVVMGATAAESYKVGVGDTMTLYNSRYKVVGLFETGVAWEEGGGLLALSEAQSLLNRPRSVSFMFVDVKNPSDADAVRATIEMRFPDAKASISSDFAQNTADIQSTQAFAGAIGLLAMVIGGIVVANTMLMTIYERTREIGTLRAVGWPGRRIVGQVLQESLLLCLLAAALGCLLGIGLLALAVNAPGFGGFLKPVWTVGTFAQAVIGVLVLALLGSLYPAWRVSRLRPVEALQYE